MAPGTNEPRTKNDRTTTRPVESLRPIVKAGRHTGTSHRLRENFGRFNSATRRRTEERPRRRGAIKREYQEKTRGGEEELRKRWEAGFDGAHELAEVVLLLQLDEGAEREWTWHRNPGAV